MILTSFVSIVVTFKAASLTTGGVTPPSIWIIRLGALPCLSYVPALPLQSRIFAPVCSVPKSCLGVSVFILPRDKFSIPLHRLAAWMSLVFAYLHSSKGVQAEYNFSLRNTISCNTRTLFHYVYWPIGMLCGPWVHVLTKLTFCSL
jgi:hypothetical protein